MGFSLFGDLVVVFVFVEVDIIQILVGLGLGFVGWSVWDWILCY